MKRIKRFWQTVRHLTGRQLIYQVLHRLRGPAKLRLPKTSPTPYFLAAPIADKPVSWQQNRFTFLNQSVQFSGDIDWNYTRFGKLWTYTLNYFDFLNQHGMAVQDGLTLMQDFMRQTNSLRDGLETYPTSLRIINWVQFMSRHQIRHDGINRHLFAQVSLLNRRLEYHLAGNHLLENGFALLTGAIFFRHTRWFTKATRLIYSELTTQILADGGHDERSPIYHQLLLNRLLDILAMVETDTWQPNLNLTTFLTEKATQMLDWLDAVTFQNGDVPMMNDAAPGVAPTTAALRKKEKWSERATMQKLTVSGYRMFRQARYELLADVGPVGPDHQPGHAHADTFSFVLYVDNVPLIVDSGTSTYQPGPRRHWERSTAAHNTVEVRRTNSSDVWAAFRVGRRAQVRLLTDTETVLSARHDGYKPFGLLHERSWRIEPNRVLITDRLLHIPAEIEAKEPGIARFYFHPAVSVRQSGDAVVAGPLKISFHSATKYTISVITVNVAIGFNQLIPSQYLEIEFVGYLETVLTLSG